MNTAWTDVVIYHNPACGTSRNTLAMIRNAGIEPHIVEYLKTPPTGTLLSSHLSLGQDEKAAGECLTVKRSSG